MKLHRRAFTKKLNEIIDQVYNTASDMGWSWIRIAAESGLHHSTIYKLGNRETKEPRFSTVFSLCMAVGAEVQVQFLKAWKKAV